MLLRDNVRYLIYLFIIGILLLGGCVHRPEPTTTTTTTIVTDCGNKICESGENGYNCPQDCCVSGDGKCPAGCEAVSGSLRYDDDCDCYLNLAETTEYYALEKENFWYGVLATDNYNVLGEEPKRKDEIVQLIKKAQNEDGTWNTHSEKIHYAPNTARTLMALSRLDVDFSTIKPLEPFLETVDTWEEVTANVQEFKAPDNFWGDFWGHITIWNVYKNQAPPYRDDFMNTVNSEFDSWAYDTHQRNHLIDMLRQLCIPFPRRDEVVQIILRQQEEDGSWMNGNCGETAQTIIILNYLNASADEAKQKAIDFIWNKCYIEMNIDDKRMCGFKGFPEEDRVSSNPNPSIIAVLIQEGYLDGDPAIYMKWRSCHL